MAGDTGRNVHRVHRYAEKVFGMSPELCDMVLNDVSGSTQELADLFDINIGQMRSYEEILAEANATLQALSLKSAMQAQQFKARSETDALTGIPNRRKLEEDVALEFERAHKFMRPLSVIFLDADHFKKVNDTLGHAAGDEALCHLANILRDVARPMDTIGRYGGEEFVVILPEVSMSEAVKLAESLRRLVESAPPTLAGKSWPLTISVGVACYDGVAGPYRQAAQLIQAADKAAYAAKAAGRNTVRAFNPKPRTKAAGKSE